MRISDWSSDVCSSDLYPAISNRLGETGSVVLRMLVGVNGKVTDSKIQTSSGYPRLDEAARRALSLCKFEPAIVDGVPTPAWGLLKYTFVDRKSTRLNSSH